MKTYVLKHLDTEEIVFWSVDQILKEINRDRSSTWEDYDEKDWPEGLYFTRYALEPTIKPKYTKGHQWIVNQIVDRIHVCRSNRDVIRKVKNGMVKGVWYALSRTTRKRIMRDAIARHKANRELFAFVDRGMR